MLRPDCRQNRQDSTNRTTIKAMETFKLNTIEEAIADFKEGKFVIVVDDEDRENEGDFITSAQMITPEKVNFMLQEGRGVLCAPITIQRSEELDLPHQVSNNTSILRCPDICCSCDKTINMFVKSRKAGRNIIRLFYIKWFTIHYVNNTF